MMVYLSGFDEELRQQARERESTRRGGGVFGDRHHRLDRLSAQEGGK
jgi:hypothetical protein